MKFFDRKRRQPPAVIIISLIDVLIVMLIFLMVTTTFKDQPALKLALPEAKQPSEGSMENNLIVTVAAQEPYFYVGTIPVTLDKLQEVFASTVRTNPQAAVSVRPDKNSVVQNFLHVIEAAKAAGIRASVNVHVNPGQ